MHIFTTDIVENGNSQEFSGFPEVSREILRIYKVSWEIWSEIILAV